MKAKKYSRNNESFKTNKKANNARYVDFEINGKLFPSWILKNFKHYKLPEIILIPGLDPCNIKTPTDKSKSGKVELRKYQQFVSEYLSAESPYKGILLYHGLGSGKTAASINLYNILYNSSPKWNMFVLLKSSLRESWTAEIEKFIDDVQMKNNIHFINYDSPSAITQYKEKKRTLDAAKKTLFVIEEAHNFINSVYGSVKKGMLKNSILLYEEILQEQKENAETKVVLLSGTPIINKPFELALLFNLLRPGTFQSSEDEFNHMFVLNNDDFVSLNPATKNMFQRRIIGLVSYYYGSTPDYFAKTINNSVNSEMSEYQYSIYLRAQALEDEISLKMFRQNKKSSLFKTYVRQASNFVYPDIFNGEYRPLTSDFKFSENDLRKLGPSNTATHNSDAYQKKLVTFTSKFIKFINELREEDNKTGNTLEKDISSFVNSNMSFDEFNTKCCESKLYKALHNSSAKYTNAILNIMRSTGPGLVYSNYVKNEGIAIFKLYLSYFGFGKSASDEKYKYVEFHGEIDIKDRYKGMKLINDKLNINGDKIKLILISASGVEGLNLRNIRTVHILDPYWNETRITQVIGRAVRICSHMDLPINDRVVNIYRYHSTYTKSPKMLVDNFIELNARKKKERENSFLSAIKEAAIDCVLYKNHNMINKKYKCFQFSENSLFDKYIGPAYRKNIQQDNTKNAFQTMSIKVRKIKAVKVISQTPVRYSVPEIYLYHKTTSVVYDLDLHYPVGKLLLNEQNQPEIFKENIYIIDKVIMIPMIKYEA